MCLGKQGLGGLDNNDSSLWFDCLLKTCKSKPEIQKDCPESLVAGTPNSLQKSISQSASEKDVRRQETQKVPEQGLNTYWRAPKTFILDSMP